MARESLNDLLAFVAVARERSFTRAAAQLGVSQPALSKTLRELEARLGLRLLSRTTRSVAPTEAGERLLQSLAPRFAQIENGLAALAEQRGRVSGTVRITATEHAAGNVLWPILKRLLPHHPEIRVEIVIDYGATDILAQRLDAGVRHGGVIAKDMTAMRIGPDARMAAVATPSYFADGPRPTHPEDLTAHACINLRLPTHGGLHAWEFEKEGRALKVRVDGQLVLNTATLVLEAALSGFGIAYLPEDRVKDHVRDGRLVRVLADWCPLFPGYHLHYPSRRQPTPAFRLLIEALHPAST